MLNQIKKQWWLLIPSLIGLIILGIYLFQLSSPEPVVAHQVHQEDVLVTLTITGEVQADNTVNITAPIQSRIQDIFVDDGDYVQAGQVLVELDSDALQAGVLEAQAQVAKARASLQFILEGTRQEDLARLENSSQEASEQIESAQADYDKAQRFAKRMEPLHKDGAISDNEYDDAITQVKNTRANLKSAKFRLAQAKDSLQKGKTGATQSEINEVRAAYRAAQGRAKQSQEKLKDQYLKSNLTGIVLARLQEAGEIAQPNAPILKIADQNTIEVIGFVEEADLSRVKIDDDCYVILDANPEKALAGKVKRIGSEVNPENGTVEIKIKLQANETDITLLPGMTADINVITDKLKDSVVVPATAVYKADKKLWAFKLDGGQVKKIELEAQRISLEYFQIIKGLQPDDWIARTASPDLLEKKRVKAIPFKEDSKRD